MVFCLTRTTLKREVAEWIDEDLLVNVDCSGIRLVHRLRLRLLVVGWNLLVVRRIDSLASLCGRAILLRPGVVLAVETSI